MEPGAARSKGAAARLQPKERREMILATARLYSGGRHDRMGPVSASSWTAKDGESGASAHQVFDTDANQGKGQTHHESD